jgi:hypothetical protein
MENNNLNIIKITDEKKNNYTWKYYFMTLIRRKCGIPNNNYTINYLFKNAYYNYKIPLNYGVNNNHIILNDIFFEYLARCYNTTETFGRKLAYIDSIMINDEDYKHKIISHLPPVRIIDETLTLANILNINYDPVVKIIFRQYAEYNIEEYEWVNCKDTPLHVLLKLH